MNQPGLRFKWGLNMNRKILILACLGLISSCASLRDAGRAYFKPNNKWAGVQTPQEVIKRTENNKKIRTIIYGPLTEDKIIECTILRNQVYVASLLSLGKQDKQELKLVSDILEEAYQFDDQAFLEACDQVKNSHVGRLFMGIQKSYFRSY